MVSEGTGALEASEAAAAAVAKTSNRVTLDHIKSKVDRIVYFRDDILTIAVVTTVNGFKLVGQSACADPANYNQELGEKIAREDAIKQLWAIEGYLLRESLHNGG